MDLGIAVAAAPELDLAGLEAAVALGDEHDLACAAVDHRARRHGGDRRRSAPGWKTTSAYMPGFICRPGLGSSIRTETVRVSRFIISG